MNMKTFLSKLFAWISECEACEHAMYEALYDARIKPLIDKILCRDEKIARLESDVVSLKGAAVNKFLGEEKIDIYTTPSPSIIVETDNDQFEFDLSAGQWDNVDLGVDRQDPDEFFKTIYKIATEK